MDAKEWYQEYFTIIITESLFAWNSNDLEMRVVHLRSRYLFDLVNDNQLYVPITRSLKSKIIPLLKLEG